MCGAVGQALIQQGRTQARRILEAISRGSFDSLASFDFNRADGGLGEDDIAVSAQQFSQRVVSPKKTESFRSGQETRKRVKIREPSNSGDFFANSRYGTSTKQHRASTRKEQSQKAQNSRLAQDEYALFAKAAKEAVKNIGYVPMSNDGAIKAGYACLTSF